MTMHDVDPDLSQKFGQSNGEHTQAAGLLTFESRHRTKGRPDISGGDHCHHVEYHGRGV